MGRRRRSAAFVARDIVARSAPNLSRPRMSAELEARCRSVDARSAACYANLEDLSEQLGEVARELRDGELDIELPNGSNGASEDAHESDRELAVRVREAQASSRKRRADTGTHLVLESEHVK